ncbi:ATP-binding protein [Paracoccus siganidrum]|uniref:histidine kinase n=1 Tax=Paracoccus siganidrum TaxID=1276757 RepID=A0A419A0Y2_9RHOB|nr:ATP-binding protein [Paracoccus siganidrum]RJL06595.1 sensor histidine kinase [Paracoccus siganidrum]RMC34616.1 sensor histidine kinase [Paracoccus siganidrum]
MPVPTDRPSATRRPMSLATQFVLAASVTLVSGMLVIGFWVASKIERGVMNNAAAMTALYVDAIIAPVLQDIPQGGALDPGTRAALQTLLQRGELRNEISAFKLWDRQGRIVYSDNPALIGRVFAPNAGLSEALEGRVHADFDRHSHGNGGADPAQPLLEVYSPVRSPLSGDLVGVAEFYTDAGGFRQDLADARRESWLVVGGVALGMFSLLYVVFARGNRTIRRQRHALDDQIAQLSALLEKNQALRQRVEQANHRIAHLNERNLRRISAELHDGPAQLLAFAALHLDQPQTPRQEQVRQAVTDAMQEIRYICRGLALPEMEDWSVATIARRLASMHESRTGTPVALDLAPDLPELPLAAKSCIYRFIQETLNNNAKHAAGAAPKLFVRLRDGAMEIEVSDDGPGFRPGADCDGLGLAGLRERVAGIKGEFELHAQPGRGTRVVMRLPPRPEGELP